jgi:phospholipid/cholesterol/gamma-HCH transport system substrate-binding protein
VITSIILFIWGFNFLKGRDLFTKEFKILAYFDNVEGLSQASQVTFNGLPIGQVRSITYDAVKNKHLVEMKVNKDYPISKTSVAKIYEPGFISGKQLMIVPNFEDKTQVVNGDIIKGEIEVGAISKVINSLEPLEKQIEKLITNANELVVNVNGILDANAKQNIQSSLSNLNKTLEDFSVVAKDAKGLLSNNKTSINNSIQNLESTTGNFKTFSKNLTELELKKIADNLQTTLATVDQLMKDLEQGKGSMGKLLKDDRLYNNLSGASRELELLLADFKAQPKRYVNFSLIGRKDNLPPKTRDSIKIKIDN